MKMTNHYSRKNALNIFIVYFLLLQITIVSAEKVTVHIAQSIDYKGINITLVTISERGAVAIEVNNDKIKLSKNKPQVIRDITLELIETTTDTATINISKSVQCLIKEDCGDKNPCTEDFCTVLGECTYLKTQGCKFDNECKPSGSIAITDKESYCSETLEWVERKQRNAPCNYDYECQSDICLKNACAKRYLFNKLKLQITEKMAPVWLIIVFGALILLKGLSLIIWPREIKKLMREFSYIRDTTIKVFGTIAIILGLVLIAWAFL